MKRAIGILVVLWAVLMAAPAWAGDTLLSWTNPTGTEITSAGPAYTNPGGTKVYQLVVDIPDTTQSISSYLVEDQKPGTYEYVAVSYDDVGVASRVSGSATKVVTAFVSKGGPVYYVIQPVVGTFILLPVGTVLAGVACDVTQSVNGNYSVPLDQVTYTGSVRPLIVIAACG